MSNSPFAGRTKQVVIRTKTEALDRIKQHRREVHDTEDLQEFFDCAACGILERQYDDALDVAGDAKGEADGR